MKDLVLNEILLPKDEPRTKTLKNPHKITRCPATKSIKTLSQDKKYKLVFDKRVIEMDSLWCSDGTRNGDIFLDFNTELLIFSNMCRRHYRK